jgi:CheY-like chemotaxis protein
MEQEPVEKVVNGRKILLVVEGKMIRDLLVTTLKLAGAKSIVFGSPVEMMRQVKDYAPELIFCEYDMPGVNGADFVMQLRNTCKLTTPTVVLVSQHDSDGQARSRTAGANEILLMPFSVQDLLRTSKRMLALDAQRPPTQLRFGPRRS